MSDKPARTGCPKTQNPSRFRTHKLEEARVATSQAGQRDSSSSELFDTITYAPALKQSQKLYFEKDCIEFYGRALLCDRLLQTWLLQLQTWAAEGRLRTAAIHALRLNAVKPPKRLNKLMDRLTAEDASSLQAIEIIQELEEKLQKSIHPTLLFEHPTPRKLLKKLQSSS